VRNQTILLTGATGFLGSRLLEELLRQGFRVVVLKRSSSYTYRIDHLVDQYKSYDVDREKLSLAFEEQHIDCVVHTACHYGRNGGGVNEIVDSNLIFGLKLLEAAIEYNAERFINTDSFLGREVNTYSLSKKQLVDWLLHRSDKINVVNLKLEHMYGPNDDSNKFLVWLASQLKQNVPDIKLTSGKQKRDFIYIDDVVSAFLHVKEVVESLNGNVDTYLDFGAIPYRQGEQMVFKVDNEPLRLLGWYPKTSLMQGLEKSLRDNI
jgi:nucleoside-diphosphate-sugar epimerase